MSETHKPCTMWCYVLGLVTFLINHCMHIFLYNEHIILSCISCIISDRQCYQFYPPSSSLHSNVLCARLQKYSHLSSSQIKSDLKLFIRIHFLLMAKGPYQNSLLYMERLPLIIWQQWIFIYSVCTTYSIIYFIVQIFSVLNIFVLWSSKDDVSWKSCNCFVLKLIVWLCIKTFYS